MATDSTTRTPKKKKKSPQLDLFAEPMSSAPGESAKHVDLVVNTSRVDDALRSLCVEFKAGKKIAEEDLRKCHERIRTIVAHIDKERDGYCHDLRKMQESIVSNFKIFPVKSPYEHLRRAHILVDGRSKDWEKVNSDLKLAFYKTAGNTLKGVFVRSGSRAERKRAG